MSVEIKFGTEELDQMSLTEMMDVPLDAIEDAGFPTPPRGLYLLGVACKKTVVGKGDTQKEAIQLMMTIKKTLELADPKEKPLQEGTQFARTYNAGKAQQFFITNFRPVLKELGCKTYGDAIEKLNDVVIRCAIDHQKDQNDASKVYPMLKNMELAKL